MNGKSNWSFTGKNSERKVKDNGDYTFKYVLFDSDNPTLKITNAKIVLKK